MSIHTLASKVISLPETPSEFGRLRPPQQRVH
jgi:hypothetical protein